MTVGVHHVIVWKNKMIPPSVFLTSRTHDIVSVLFDTRKILCCTPVEGKGRSMDFSHVLGKKEKMRACQCTVVHKEKLDGKQVFYLSLWMNKITRSHKKWLCSVAY